MNTVAPAQADERKRHRCFAIALLAVLTLPFVAGCPSPGMKEDITRLPASFSLPPATSGPLAEIAASITAEHGDDRSGFGILDSSRAGLHWRLALIDAATTSLDIQTYLWYPDVSGKLLLERAVRAAERGVKVRIIVDDLLLQGLDQLIVNLEAQPNIEFRIFNPWKGRGGLIDRAGEMLAELERLNTRMHDKLLIADGHAAVIGGRNIGDHYFGLNENYNFHDTDVLGVGAVGQQAGNAFDSFWNSEWVVSAQNLTTAPDSSVARSQWESIVEANRSAAQLAAFASVLPEDGAQALLAKLPELRIGRSRMIYDESDGAQIDQKVFASMFNFFGIAQHELLIINAYVIPGQAAVDYLGNLSENGVDIRLLTNSLASHDVPAVNSHYEPWRDDLLQAGVELYEFRSDPAIQATVIDVPPTAAQFSGLHSKSAVVDRRYVFVGSMNLDPRSANINTEMGIFVDSPELAEDLAQIILRDMSGANAWRVQLDEKGDLFWQNDDEILDRQPARSGMQRIMNVLMKIGPKDQY